MPTVIRGPKRDLVENAFYVPRTILGAWVNKGNADTPDGFGCCADVVRVGTPDLGGATDKDGGYLPLTSGASVGSPCGIGGSNGTKQLDITMRWSIEFIVRMVTIDTQRAVIGLSSRDLTDAIGADDPAGHHFFFHQLSGEKTWHIAVKDGTTMKRENTRVKVDLLTNKFSFLNMTNGEVRWKISDASTSLLEQGHLSSNLPLTTNLMEPMVGVEAREAVAKKLADYRCTIFAD
jgi:hypothetical protein